MNKYYLLVSTKHLLGKEKLYYTDVEHAFFMGCYTRVKENATIYNKQYVKEIPRDGISVDGKTINGKEIGLCEYYELLSEEEYEKLMKSIRIKEQYILHKDFNGKNCVHCYSTNLHQNVMDKIDDETPSEIRYYCKDCEEFTGDFMYGHYEYS